MNKSNLPKISVIIPIYNVKEFLNQCLDSVINQTLIDLEIIGVDDGSTDGSLDILKEYAKKDDRVIVLEQENQGAGTARNSGLSVAKGQYIHFFDSDDYLELNAYELMYKYAIQENVEILNAKAYSVDVSNNSNISDKHISYSFPKLLETDFYRVINFEKEPLKLIGIAVQPWNGLYSRKFLLENDIKYNNLKCNNDRSFYAESIAKSERAIFIQDFVLYHRINNQNSLMGIRSKNFNCVTDSYFIVENMINSQENISPKNKSLLLQAELNDVINWYNNYKDNINQIEINSIYDKFCSKIDLWYLNNLLNCEFLPNVKKFFNENSNGIRLKSSLTIKNHDKKNTNNKISVSVIIPIYNVEKYLNECLDSVINQTLENIEIICINDGSTDTSFDILNEYAIKDNRIIVLTQINQGQSVARNKGISIAKGNYIYFLDSDDMIVPHALERAYSEVVNNNLDVVYFDGTSFYENSELEEKYAYYKTLYRSKFNSDIIMSGAKMFAQMHENNSYRVQSCLYLMRTEFLKEENIIFPERIIHQDNVFMLKTILVANRVKHINDQLFLRRVRANSTITQGITFNHFYGYLICYIEMLNYANKFEYTEDVEKVVTSILKSILKGASSEYSLLSLEEKEKIKKLSHQEKYYFNMLLSSKHQSNTMDFSSSNDSNTNQLNGQLRWVRETLESVRAERLELKKELKKVKDIESSTSYKLGRMITWLPRKIRNIFK